MLDMNDKPLLYDDFIETYCLSWDYLQVSFPSAPGYISCYKYQPILQFRN